MTVSNPILEPEAFQFRTGFYNLPVPPWLCTDNGEAYMYSLEYARDLLCQRAYGAMTIRLPGVGDPSNRPYLAFDRNLVQGPAETGAQLDTRLTGAFQAWGEAGGAGAVLEQLQAYMSNLQPGVPATNPLLTIVQAPTNGSPTYTTWNQLYQGDPQGAPGTLTRVSPANFLWDALPNQWRAWLVVPLAFVQVAGIPVSFAATTTSTSSACYQVPGQIVAGVAVPATSGTPVNAPWITITGLTGLTGAQVGQWLVVQGSSNPGNNGAFPIVDVPSSSSCVIANPNGVPGDAGPFLALVVAYPWIGPGPAWGSFGVVFGQGEASPPPVETGSIVGGVAQPAIQQAPVGTAPLFSWGLNCSSLVVQSIRQIVRVWKSASTYYPQIIFAFDAGAGTAGSAYSPNSLPGTGNPNSTFGSVGAIAGGIATPTRLIPTSNPYPNTYDCFAQGTGMAVNCAIENLT